MTTTTFSQAAARAGTPALLITLAFAATLVALHAIGLTMPWVSPDTESWLTPCSDGGCWGGPRTPFYAWLSLQDRFPLTVVVAQFAALLGAALLLCHGVRTAGGSSAAGCATGIAVVTSNVVLLWARAILPEAFAHAALIAALGFTLMRRPGTAGALVAGACLLKPAFLPFAVVTPLLSMLIHRRRGVLRLVTSETLILLAVALMRYRLAGDFNIVSFGGFQVAGIAALLVTPDLAVHLPGPYQAMATEIIERRSTLIAAGQALPIPLNSHGVRSFASAALGYYDILARTYDPVLYDAVRPLRGTGESWAHFNARLQHFTLAVITLRPTAYVAWVVGGLMRAAGRIAVFNPALLVCVAGCLLTRWRATWLSQDRRILFGLVGIWLPASIVPSVMLSFPAGRYIDSAGMLLAALPLYELLRRMVAER